MEKEMFRQYGYKFVDWLTDYFEEIEEYPVLSPVKPGSVLNQLPEKPLSEVDARGGGVCGFFCVQSP